jgi:hypothetical protein
MAKKQTAQKKPAKAAKVSKHTKKPATKGSSPLPSASAIVLYTLRDTGASTVRFHSEHQDVNRALGTAFSLANSPDVSDTFVLRNVEVIRPFGPT